MKKFRDWLDSTPGLATLLRKSLVKDTGHSINATCVSNVKMERRLIPTSWMPTVAKMSKGSITCDYLVIERNKLEKQLKRGTS